MMTQLCRCVSLTDRVNPDAQPLTRTGNTIPQMPLLHAIMTINCQCLVHQSIGQLTLVAMISSLISFAIRTKKRSRTRKSWKRMTNKNPIVMARRKTSYYYVPQRNNLCPSLRIIFRCNIASNKAAFCRRF